MTDKYNYRSISLRNKSYSRLQNLSNIVVKGERLSIPKTIEKIKDDKANNIEKKNRNIRKEGGEKMKVKDLLHYLINYEEEGFSLEDNVKVRMYLDESTKEGRRGDHVAYKDCEPGGVDEGELNLIIHETAGVHWTFEKEGKK